MLDYLNQLMADREAEDMRKTETGQIDPMRATTGGAVVGIVVVSNVMQWFLQHARITTLGVLMGFLLGAVLGLWPFHAPVEEAVLLADHGMSPEQIENLKPRDWPVAGFEPSNGQALAAVGLVFLGFLISLGISMLGRDPEEAPSNPA